MNLLTFIAPIPKKLLTGSLMLLGLVLAGTSAAQTEDSASLAWADLEGGVYNIYYSRLEGGNWVAPMQITDSDKQQILPSIAEGDEGSVWIVWTELRQGDGKLRYRYRSGGEWQPIRAIETPHINDTAAAVAIDRNGDPWLVWSGTKEGDDEIFYARWNIFNWTEPGQINLDDQWPDILPTLGIGDNGLPIVSWFGYDGDLYVEYTSSWTGTEWTAESKSGEKLDGEGTSTNSKARKMADRIDAATLSLPIFLRDRSQASIQFRHEGRTLNLRLK